MSEHEASDTRTVAYPFVRDTFSYYDEGSETEELTWKPGIRYEHRGPYPDSEPVSVADAIGRMELTIVSVHKPGRFPTRVFYTRKWIDPDGKRFGKTRLRMTTQATFNTLARGYRHPYELVQRTELKALP